MRLTARTALWACLILAASVAFGVAMEAVAPPELFVDPCPGVHLVEDSDGGCKHHQGSLAELLFLLGGIVVLFAAVAALFRFVGTEGGDGCD